MKKDLALALIAAAMLAIVAERAITAPEPAPAPQSWELTFTHDKPQAIEVKLPGQDEPQTFWYLRYRIANNTGDDQFFIPEFAIYTDTGELVPAGKGVPQGVFEKIQKVYNDPLLKDPASMKGKVLQGDDNAKRGVAIWRNFDPKAGGFDLFVSGLSGESQTIKLPAPIEVKQMNEDGEMETVEIREITLVKTLKLTYGLIGEGKDRIDQKIKYVDQKWIMR